MRPGFPGRRPCFPFCRGDAAFLINAGQARKASVLRRAFSVRLANLSAAGETLKEIWGRA